MKVNFEELKNKSYEEGKAMLLAAGYVSAGCGESEAIISDYVIDEYFTLFADDDYAGDDGELDTVGYSCFYNRRPEKPDDEDDFLVKKGWSEV